MQRLQSFELTLRRGRGGEEDRGLSHKQGTRVALTTPRECEEEAEGAHPVLPLPHLLPHLLPHCTGTLPAPPTPAPHHTSVPGSARG